MAGKKRWTIHEVKDGVVTVDLANWKNFDDYIQNRLLDYRTYVFRGQADQAWPLRSSLDRSLESKGAVQSAELRNRHLSVFRQAARGRRGSNPPNLASDNDWWALGQHFGLVTPLLDFTESPYVALYFAFEDKLETNPEYRVVWALAEASVQRKGPELLEQHKSKALAAAQESLKKTGAVNALQEVLKTQTPPPAIAEIVRPQSDENSRLVSQRGLFVRVPDRLNLEDWVKSSFPGESNKYILIRIRVPNKAREKVLIALNLMNINHLSLFPDLFGASKYCNAALHIRNY